MYALPTHTSIDGFGFGFELAVRLGGCGDVARAVPTYIYTTTPIGQIELEWYVGVFGSTCGTQNRNTRGG